MISKNVQLQIILKMICLAKNTFPVKFSNEKGNGPTQSCLTLPDNVRSTVQQTNSKFYPNISTILRLLFLMSVSAASVERSHSRFKNVKTKKRSVMSKDRLNSLMLLYVHRDLQLDYDKIMDIYVSNYPRRLQLAYPLLWCSTPWCISCLTIHTNTMIIKRLCQIVFFVIIYLCYNVSNIAQIAKKKYVLKTRKPRKLPGASPPGPPDPGL